MEFNDRNLILLRRRSDAVLPLVLVDENDAPVHPTAVRYSFVDPKDQDYKSGQFGPEGDSTQGITKEGSKPNVFWFSVNTRTGFRDPTYLFFVDAKLNGGGRIETYRLLRVLENCYYRIMPYLRLQLDKARKSQMGASLDLQAEDYNFNNLDWEYRDAHMAAYLDLGCQMINLISPQTYFTVPNFPFAMFGQLLIEAAMISALDSQQLFAVDTDFDYSLGGNAIRVDHLAGLSGFARELVDRFNMQVKVFKQRYRSKGTALIQVQYGIGLGRFLNVVPSGWWSRFGIAVSPPSVPARFGQW